MGRRRKNQWVPPVGPHPCYFGCGRSLITKYDRQAIEGWEWFTGYGEQPIHFCAPCRKARQYDIDRLREKLNTKPVGYPKVRAKL